LSHWKAFACYIKLGAEKFGLAYSGPRRGGGFVLAIAPRRRAPLPSQKPCASELAAILLGRPRPHGSIGMASPSFEAYDRNLRRIYLAEFVDDHLQACVPWQRRVFPNGTRISEKARSEVRNAMRASFAATT
jgi:hypothetical protein